MNINKTKIDVVKDIIDSLKEDDIIKYWNGCDSAIATNQTIYDMEDLNDVLKGMTPWEIAKLLQDNPNFNIDNKYFIFNNCNMVIRSFNHPFSIYDEDILAEHILKYHGNILDKYKDSFIEAFNDEYFALSDAMRVIKLLVDFGHANIIKDDWGKLSELVSELIKDK